MEDMIMLTYRHQLDKAEMAESAAAMDERLAEIEELKIKIAGLNAEKKMLANEVAEISKIRRQGFEIREELCGWEWSGEYREWFNADGELVKREHMNELRGKEKPGPLHNRMQNDE